MRKACLDMLYELECDAFATIIDGKRIPRGKIHFNQGLNTIQGDKLAQNSSWHKTLSENQLF